MTGDDREGPGAQPAKLRRIEPHEIAIRFAFGAAVSVAAGTVSIIWGPKAGGLFLAFPAILPAALTLIERKEGTDKARANVAGAVFGGIGLIAYAVFVRALTRDLTSPLLLALALVVWTLVAGGTYFAWEHTLGPSGSDEEGGDGERARRSAEKRTEAAARRP